jgi:hypothetical protein
MPRIATVFDANLYRGLDRKAVEKIRLAEAGTGVTAVPSPLTAIELIARFAADLDTEEFRRSKAALERLWQHCHVFDGRTAFMRFPGTPEAMIGQSVFGARAPKQREIAARLGTTVRRIAQSPRDDRCSGAGRETDAIAIICARMEERFVTGLTAASHMMRSALQLPGSTSLDPERRKEYLALRAQGQGRRYAAEAILANVADLYARDLNADEKEQFVTALASAGAVAFELFDTMVEKILLSGMSIGGNANYIWDFYLALFASPGATMDGIPLRLVSNDLALHRAAAVVNRQHLVWTQEEYLRRLSEGPEALSDAADGFNN